jgi:hypothetical protein
VGALVMEPSAHRVMGDGAMRNFLDHYVPRNALELQVSMGFK